MLEGEDKNAVLPSDRGKRGIANDCPTKKVPKRHIFGAGTGGSSIAMLAQSGFLKQSVEPFRISRESASSSFLDGSEGSQPHFRLSMSMLRCLPVS